MLKRNFNIALIEKDIVWGDKAANMEQLKRELALVPQGTDLVVLPELFSTGFITGNRDEAQALAERNSGETMQTLHELAQKYQVAFCGSFLAATAGQLFNRAFFIEPSGEDTFYDKKHLFAFGGENEIYHHGHTQAPIIRFRGFNIKLIVCYDLRFPVFCRNVNNNYDILVAVANWPSSRQHVWQTLLTARAMENECFVCGVNRAGIDGYGAEHGHGSSFIIDFKGKIISQTSDTTPIATASFSPEDLEKFRSKFPAWRDADPFTLK
ncbi:nitrilase-related carbon-nitrogen hydrolase [Sodaliphilus sp.]|uniref:nitrilase-related carbon-nitrogen hydrolase n=1 Tax=Sodaliphilus sp. TaxID=2815818 RepID=UPI00388F51A7